MGPHLSHFSPSTAAPTTIRVFTVPPSFAGMFLNKMAKLTCLVTDLVTYDSLDISWAHDGGDKLKTSFKVSDSHLNGTFSAVGEASIFVEDWKSGKKFTCTVIHKDLPAPLKHTISYSNGRHLFPQLGFPGHPYPPLSLNLLWGHPSTPHYP